MRIQVLVSEPVAARISEVQKHLSKKYDGLIWSTSRVTKYLVTRGLRVAEDEMELDRSTKFNNVVQ